MRIHHGCEAHGRLLVVQPMMTIFRGRRSSKLWMVHRLALVLQAPVLIGLFQDAESVKHEADGMMSVCIGQNYAVLAVLPHWNHSLF